MIRKVNSKIKSFVRATFAAGILITGLGATNPAEAQYIRDSEIERTLKLLSEPIFRSAGLSNDTVNMFIIQNNDLNAFVAGGKNIFLHTGLLRQLEDPTALISVIAHEVGHITGGHLVRRQAAFESATAPAAIITLLGVLAGAAAGSAEVGVGALAGGQTIIQRELLRYTRGEEASADQAGFDFMDRAGIDSSGALVVLDKLKQREVFSVTHIDPYAQTHPLSSERITLLRQRVENSPNRGAKLDPEFIYWHARMRAKLDGYINRPETTISKISPSTTSEFELYELAVAYHLLPEPEEALATVDRLLQMKPNDPFYWELRGDILYQSARPIEASEAYAKSVSIAPNEPLLRAAYGRALLGQDNPAADAEALKNLEVAQLNDPLDSSLLRPLAIAYARNGQEGMAALATAEAYALRGRIKDSHHHAKRAEAQLPTGSPGWLRAQDILAIKMKKK